MKALIVDPSTVFQMLLSKLITEIGFETVSCRTSDDALRRVASEPIDIICLSMHIDHRSGIDLCKQIRTEHVEHQETPIVVITTEEDRDTLKQALDSGITQIFKKTALDTLDQYLRNVLWSTHSEREQMVATGRIAFWASDENSTQKTTKSLEFNGMRVDVLQTASECKQALEETSYDLLLIDASELDDPATLAFTVNIRQLKAFNSLPIIIVSDKTGAASRISLLRAGANDFMAAPIIEEELLLRVQNQIRAKKLLERVEEQQNVLREMAMRDQLTSLYNRHFLMEVGPQKINEAERHQHELSMLVIDLDHFKQINDQHGHSTGDTVLEETGQLLIKMCRNEDVAVRFGGEEFVIVLSHCSIEQAQAKAEEIRCALEKLRPAGLTVTASIGVSALSLNVNDNMGALFSRADKAVYLSKTQGRNRTTLVSYNLNDTNSN